MKRKLSFFLLIVLLLSCFSGCDTQKSNHQIGSLNELDSRKIKIISARGSACSAASMEYFPHAEQLYTDYEEEGLKAIVDGSADAFLIDKPTIDKALMTNSNYMRFLTLFGEPVCQTDISVGLQKDDEETRKLFNDFIAQLKEKGTLEDMLTRWCVGSGEDILPNEIPEPETSTRHMVIGTCGFLQPWSYVTSNGELVGFDIEFIRRFAVYADADIEIVTMNFGELTDALRNRTIDAVVSNLQITNDREEEISYSDPYLTNDIVVCMRRDRVTEESKRISELSDMNNEAFRLISETGSACALTARELFPEAEMVYGTLTADCFVSVLEGKVDGYVIEKATYEKSTKANPTLAKGLTTYGGPIGTIDIAVGMPKGQEELKDLFNRFIAEIKSDGTAEDMYRRWVIGNDRVMPDIPVPEEPTLTLTVGTCGFLEPWSYVGDNGALNGYDIEFIRRFANFANAEIDIQVMGFDALVASLESGRLDAVVSNLNVTAERAKIIDYSDPYFVSQIVVCVHRDLLGLTKDKLAALTLEQMNGKIVGLSASSPFNKICRSTFSDSTVNSFLDSEDLLQHLKSYSIDVAALTEAEIAAYAADEDNMIVLNIDLCETDTTFFVNERLSELRENINVLLRRYRENNTLSDLRSKWITGKHSMEETIDVSTELAAPNGVLNVHAVTGKPGFSFINADGELVGYDVELMRMLARDLGYTCVFTPLTDAESQESLRLSKADIEIGEVLLTDELLDGGLCTEPTGTSVCKLVMMDGGAPEKEQTFAEKTRESFRRTFIEESRWKMILGGVATTMKITVLSVLFGTFVGILFSFVLRCRIPFIRSVANELSAILNATPIVVILMVLYYIIFSASSIAPLYVAVIGFALDFGNTTAGLMNTGIASVGKGQVESAVTLGYSRWRIFTDILFPQAARRMFATYRSSIINLLKATAIVGYITIEDLTRVSDIIRSRTFDAFFPLISTAVIYILLSLAIVAVLKAFDRVLDPKHRVKVQMEAAK